MTRTSLSLVPLVATGMFSLPAFAEDIRSGTWGGAKSDEGAEVSTSELVELLKTGATVLDVRSAKECAIAHIPGSVCMPGVLRSDGSYGDNLDQISTPILIGLRQSSFTATGHTAENRSGLPNL